MHDLERHLAYLLGAGVTAYVVGVFLVAWLWPEWLEHHR